MEDDQVRRSIAFGQKQSKRLRAQLNAALSTFETVKGTAQALLNERLAFLDADTHASLVSFDERISALFVETVRFGAFFKTTYARPLTPVPIQKIDPDSDQALIIRELLAVSKQLDESTQAIAKNSSGEVRVHHIDEMVRASKIILDLLDPLLTIERGESN